MSNKNYDKILKEDMYRRERNVRLLRRLENIEKKAAFLQAKTDRIRSLKSIYKNQFGNYPISDIKSYPNYDFKKDYVTNEYNFKSNYNDKSFNNQRILKNITLDEAIEEIARRYILIPKTPLSKKNEEIATTNNISDALPKENISINDPIDDKIAIEPELNRIIEPEKIMDVQREELNIVEDLSTQNPSEIDNTLNNSKLNSLSVEDTPKIEAPIELPQENELIKEDELNSSDSAPNVDVNIESTTEIQDPEPVYQDEDLKVKEQSYNPTMSVTNQESVNITGADNNLQYYENTDNAEVAYEDPNYVQNDEAVNQDQYYENPNPEGYEQDPSAYEAQPYVEQTAEGQYYQENPDPNAYSEEQYQQNEYYNETQNPEIPYDASQYPEQTYEQQSEYTEQNYENQPNEYTDQNYEAQPTEYAEQPSEYTDQNYEAQPTEYSEQNPPGEYTEQAYDNQQNDYSEQNYDSQYQANYENTDPNKYSEYDANTEQSENQYAYNENTGEEQYNYYDENNTNAENADAIPQNEAEAKPLQIFDSEKDELSVQDSNKDETSVQESDFDFSTQN